MAITDYSELQTAIAEWAARSDISTAQVQEFIALCESRLETLLPVRSAEDYETITATTSSRVLTPATQFIEPIALFVTTFGQRDRLTPFASGTMVYDEVAGHPSAWTVVGATIELDKPADQAHTFEFLRRARFYQLATTDPNWVLTNHPGVYLAGSLVELYRFTKEIEQDTYWETRFQDEIDRVRCTEEASKLVGQAAVDPGLTFNQRAGFNINSGYY